jgi:two-component system sensor histidine kinase TtrS
MKRLFLLFICLLMSLPAQAAPALTIGVTESAAYGMLESFLFDTVSRLQAAFLDRYRVEVKFFTDDALKEEIRSNRLDLAITPASLARVLIPKGSGEMASAVSAYSQNPNKAQGAVFLTDGRRTGAYMIEDFRGGRVVTGQNFGLSGLDALLSAAALKTEKPSDGFFGSVGYYPKIEDLLAELKAGRADIAVLPACALEHYSASHETATDWIRVLEPKQNSDFNCAYSGMLFPGTTVWSLPSLPPQASKTVIKTLLEMPPMDGMSWEIATDFSTVDRMLESLNKDAWAPLREWSWKKIWERYSLWIMLLAGAVLLLIYHGVVTERLVRLRTAALEKALDRQKELHKEARAATRRFEKLQKASTIGLMATLFAHELRQPLNAIACYSHGIKRLLTKPESESLVEEGIRSIEKEAQRASDIVEHVREYVRSKTRRRVRCNWTAVISQAVRDFQTTSDGATEVRWKGKDALWVLADELELELIVINLLRNAAQAQDKVRKPWISVTLGKEKGTGYIAMEVRDNGPALTDEAFEAIISTGDTTKPEGLGLGLSIVKSLTEAHGGDMRLALSETRGLLVTIRLPEDNGN